VTDTGSLYVQVVALGLDPAWRCLPADVRAEDGRRLIEAEARSGEDGVRTLSYSSFGLEPGVDMVLVRLAETMDAVEAAGARLARSGLGRYLGVRHSLLGLVQPSQYVAKPTEQERSILDGEPRRYLIAYPFTKSADWYLLSRETRQGIMNEHMRVGRAYPAIRQVLASSFGIDDADFLVAYDTDDLTGYVDLVRELRGTQGRRSTVSDRPMLLGIRRSFEAFVEMAGPADG
jgi:chlorite dismutase